MGKWVSTASIAMNHAQTLQVIAKLKLHWPDSARVAMSILSVGGLDLGTLNIDFARPECLTTSSDSPTFFIYKITRVTVPLLLATERDVRAARSCTHGGSTGSDGKTTQKWPTRQLHYNNGGNVSVARVFVTTTQVFVVGLVFGQISGKASAGRAQHAGRRHGRPRLRTVLATLLAPN